MREWLGVLGGSKRLIGKWFKERLISRGSCRQVRKVMCGLKKMRLVVSRFGG